MALERASGKMATLAAWLRPTATAARLQTLPMRLLFRGLSRVSSSRILFTSGEPNRELVDFEDVHEPLQLLQRGLGTSCLLHAEFPEFVGGLESGEFRSQRFVGHNRPISHSAEAALDTRWNSAWLANGSDPRAVAPADGHGGGSGA